MLELPELRAAMDGCDQHQELRQSGASSSQAGGMSFNVLPQARIVGLALATCNLQSILSWAAHDDVFFESNEACQLVMLIFFLESLDYHGRMVLDKLLK